MKIKIKTSKLSGASLNYAVAVCRKFKHIQVFADWGDPHGKHGPAQIMVSNQANLLYDFNPVANWAHGGPIVDMMIDRGFDLKMSDTTSSVRMFRMIGDDVIWGYGESALIATMLCYVEMTLGEEIEIPKVLLK